MTEIVNKALDAILSSHGYKHVKLVGTTEWVGLFQFMYTAAIIKGKIAEIHSYYDDRWCYHDMEAAKAALDNWDGVGEPTGWHRHPSTGRRRPNGNQEEEYINL